MLPLSHNQSGTISEVLSEPTMEKVLCHLLWPFELLTTFFSDKPRHRLQSQTERSQLSVCLFGSLNLWHNLHSAGSPLLTSAVSLHHNETSNAAPPHQSVLLWLACAPFYHSASGQRGQWRRSLCQGALMTPRFTRVIVVPSVKLSCVSAVYPRSTPRFAYWW